MARTQLELELEAALRAHGWELDGPTRTVSGWKATIRRGSVSILLTASERQEVLELLLRDVEARANKPQAQR